MQKKISITDSVFVTPYSCAKANVEDLTFSRVSFCDTFVLHSLPANKMIVFEDCIFHGDVKIESIKNVQIIIRNCRFLAKLQISDKDAGMIEFQDSDNGDDAKNADLLFHEDDVHCSYNLS